MRKIGIIILIILFVYVFVSNMSNEEEIRVRIIPNSDKKEDLLLKEEAKKYVVYYLKKAYHSDYNQFVTNINETKNSFEAILEKVLATDCTITFDEHTLYNKTYNGSAVKNEKTLVLYVVLGEGDGSNWWGTVYPEFLGISSDDEIKYESLIVNLFRKIRGDINDCN